MSMYPDFGFPRQRFTQPFDEYYRCYPIVMHPGPERPELNHGSKMFLPPSALDKLSKMHVQFPIQMELNNGKKGLHSHCGVLEFVAEEGRAYIPQWIMNTLQLDVGDMIQVKYVQLPLAKWVRLQPQHVKFLDITDPRAVLERAFRNFGTLTKGDKFNFEYNDDIYEVAVLDVKPESRKMGVSMIETDVTVDFAPPVGYVEPERKSGTSTPTVGGSGAKHGIVPGGVIHHPPGSMARDIGYDSIKPSVLAAASSNFLGTGHSVGSATKARRTGAPVTKKPETGGETSDAARAAIMAAKKRNGKLPLRLADNIIFTGYDIVPLKTREQKEKEAQGKTVNFEGRGQTLRKGGPKKEDKKDENTKKLTGTGSEGRKLGSK